MTPNEAKLEASREASVLLDQLNEEGWFTDGNWDNVDRLKRMDRLEAIGTKAWCDWRNERLEKFPAGDFEIRLKPETREVKASLRVVEAQIFFRGEPCEFEPFEAYANDRIIKLTEVINSYRRGLYLYELAVKWCPSLSNLRGAGARGVFLLIADEADHA